VLSSQGRFKGTTALTRKGGEPPLGLATVPYGAQNRAAGDAMVRFQRVMLVSGGKEREAMQWATEICQYLQKQHKSLSAIGAYMELFGRVGAVHWFADYENLAALDTVNAQLLGDEKYWARLTEANKAGLFVEGSGQDTLTQSL
jgi:hypothetical protein